MKNTMNIIGPMEINPTLIDKTLFSIVVDGGINHLLDLKSSISLGDQDSTNLKLDQVIPKEKDFSDLSYGLKHIPKGTEQINCYGLLGGRLDHQLCVLGDIIEYVVTHKISFNLFNQCSRKVAIIPAGTWQFQHQGNFSVLSTKEQRIKIDGEVKYKSTSEYTYIRVLTSHTLSNEASGLIQITNEFPLTIFFNYPTEI